MKRARFDAPSSTDGAPPLRLARLPLPLVQSVFRLATDCGEIEQLQTLAQVSREWNAHAREVASMETLQKFKINSAVTNAIALSVGAFHGLRYCLTLRRSYLRELAIVTEGSNVVSTDVWRSLLSHAPGLETLRLQRDYAYDTLPWIVAIVEAAALCCPRLHTFELPYYWHHMNYPNETTPRPNVVLVAFLEALELWKPGGGLRHVDLWMPFDKLTDHAVVATEYVKAIATTCPRLETAFNRQYPKESNVEQWYIDVQTWEQFCASCTQLTAFNWEMVPYATTFFDVFGRYPKPKLKTLVLRTDWNWDAYHRSLPTLPRGFGATAVNPQAILTACPALRELEVVLSRWGSEATEDLNEADFGDAFCVTLAKHCRQLEWFTMMESTSFAPIESFTDVAMGALATLPMLTHVDLKAVNITADGLVALAVNSSRNDWKAQREYTIRLGDRTTYSKPFYDIAAQFLARLAAWADKDELPCASDRVVLRLLNCNPNEMGDELAEHYAEVLTELVDHVLAKHPAIRLRVRLTRPEFDDRESENVLTSFGVIEEIDVYTRSASIPEQIQWSDNSNRRVNEVYVVREEDDASDDGDFDYGLYGVDDVLASDDSDGDDFDEAYYGIHHARTCPNLRAVNDLVL